MDTPGSTKESPDSTDWLPNRLFRRWLRLVLASAAATAALLAAGVGYVARYEPRLLTLSEILPPDESLVGALLPGVVALAITLALGREQRAVPAGVEVGPVGVGVSVRNGGVHRSIAWTDLELRGGAPAYLGVEVRDRRIPRWGVLVDAALAEELARRKIVREARLGSTPS